MTVFILQTFGKKDNGSFIFILTTDQISASLIISLKSEEILLFYQPLHSEKKIKNVLHTLFHLPVNNYYFL